MTILIIGGDSAEVFRRRVLGRKHQVKHWSVRKNRDLVRAIPKATDAIVVVLDRVSHALARRVRTEALRRGIPVYFRKRSRQVDADTQQIVPRLLNSRWYLEAS
jgi:hypothetical protein